MENDLIGTIIFWLIIFWLGIMAILVGSQIWDALTRKPKGKVILKWDKRLQRYVSE